MKILKITFSLVGLSLIGFCGLLMFSNPTPKDYEDFALSELSNYLNQKGCSQLTSSQPSFNNTCQSILKILIHTGKIQLKEIISSQTEQQNFLFFSVYQTTLSLPSPLPSYQVETIGIGKNFYIYNADEIKN